MNGLFEFNEFKGIIQKQLILSKNDENSMNKLALFDSKLSLNQLKLSQTIKTLSGIGELIIKS